MLIDTHCHLFHKKYSKSPDKLIAEAQKEGIEKIITVGTSLEGSSNDLQLAKDLNTVYNTVGIYPHEDRGKSFENLEQGLQKLINTSKKLWGLENVE